jgi:hypothetical protein
MNKLFDLTDRVVLVTGSAGALAGSAAEYLAAPMGAYGLFRTQLAKFGTPYFDNRLIKGLNASVPKSSSAAPGQTPIDQLMEAKHDFGEL